MAALSCTVHNLVDVVLPDGLAVGLAGILCFAITVDVGISVISAVHFSNGASEWKSRFSRSSDFIASRSSFVSPFDVLRSQSDL